MKPQKIIASLDESGEIVLECVRCHVKHVGKPKAFLREHLKTNCFMTPERKTHLRAIMRKSAAIRAGKRLPCQRPPLNQSLVLEAIKDGASTSAELMSITGLKRGQIQCALYELTLKDLVMSDSSTRPAIYTLKEPKK
jgi:predicted Rossmann fold nucleotide-binding protein DprA/Smf involved in DNA uptake